MAEDTRWEERLVTAVEVNLTVRSASEDEAAQVCRGLVPTGWRANIYVQRTGCAEAQGTQSAALLMGTEGIGVTVRQVWSTVERLQRQCSFQCLVPKAGEAQQRRLTTRMAEMARVGTRGRWRTIVEEMPAPESLLVFEDADDPWAGWAAVDREGTFTVSMDARREVKRHDLFTGSAR